jgi:hypothetical protein
MPLNDLKLSPMSLVDSDIGVKVSVARDSNSLFLLRDLTSDGSQVGTGGIGTDLSGFCCKACGGRIVCAAEVNTSCGSCSVDMDDF